MANVCKQIRLPDTMNEYIKQEAGRLDIAQNSFLVILLELGRKVWNASVKDDLMEDQ